MENNNQSDIVIGRNAVNEVIRSGREIDKIFVSRNMPPQLKPIIAKCREKNLLIKEVDSKKLDFLSGNGVHQGIIAIVASHNYCEVEDILNFAKQKNEPPFIIICDEIEDPHNLGAIIRTAEACSAHGIIIPKRRSASLNATVAKSACGALEYMNVARVTNIVSVINDLKKQNIWVYAADMDGENWCSTDFSGGCALVIGSEGRGVGALVKKSCDSVVSMPMCGKINSLNASVAAGILMYEVIRQRQGLTAVNNSKG